MRKTESLQDITPQESLSPLILASFIREASQTLRIPKSMFESLVSLISCSQGSQVVTSAIALVDSETLSVFRHVVQQAEARHEKRVTQSVLTSLALPVNL